MGEMTIEEIKAYIPARNFSLSKQFYADLGFAIVWSSDGLAYVRHGNASFLLQNFYVQVHTANFMMHMLVEDLDAWWRLVEDERLQSKYGIFLEPPADSSCGLRFRDHRSDRRAVAHRPEQARES